MKIYFTTAPPGKDRIQFFIDHFRQLDYDVEVDNEVGIGNIADVWFIDFFRSSDEDIKSFFIDNQNKILDFAGKVCLYSLDDTGYTASYLLSDSVLQRIDGWMTGIRHVKGTLLSNENVFDRLILVPWYLIPYRAYVDCPKKNRIMFYGHPTGGKNRYSNQIMNPRIEAVRRLCNHKTLSLSFTGGVVVHSAFNEPIHENIDDIKRSYIIPNDLFAIYDKTLFSLCLPGNSLWTYRHLDSMRSKCAVISFRLNRSGCSKWLYSDKLEDEFFYVEDDLSNLEEVCENVLSHSEESKLKAEYGHNIYKNFFEMNPDKTFKLSVWFELKEEFEKRGIYFNPKNEYKTVTNTYGDWWGDPKDESRGGWWGCGHDTFYEELIKKEQIKRVCEIGTYMGKSTHSFAKMLPLDGKITTIDSFKGSPEHFAEKLYTHLNNLYFNAVVNLKLGEYGNKIRIINKKSLDVEFPDGCFDLIYIDGEHNMQAVINDIVKYKKFLKEGGIISGDDYMWPEVKRGVDFCVERGIIPVLSGVYRDVIWWTKI